MLRIGGNEDAVVEAGSRGFVRWELAHHGRGHHRIIAELLQMGHSCGVGTITDANYVSNFVGERLVSKGLLQSPIPLKRHLHEMADLPDTKLVYLSRGRQGLVVMISPPQYPEVVAEECLKAAHIRSLL